MLDYRIEGKEQFESARFRSLLNNLRLFAGGRSNQLLSFEEVNKGLELHNQHYLGMKAVEVKNIVGSIDRYKDFDHYFLPKKAHLEHRWSNIYNAYKNDVPLPAVKLYKVGDIYFVVDGNHRVSVAKRMSVSFIDAEVIEFNTSIPVTRDMDPKDMFILSERKKFMEVTKLREKRPNIKIRLTIPGKYDFMLQRINDHRHYLNNRSDNGGKEYSFEDAALAWYDNVYLPSIDIINSYKIVDHFPNRTKSDLYVWINSHKYYLREKYGEDTRLADAADDFSRKFSEGFWPRIRLFLDNMLKKLKNS